MTKALTANRQILSLIILIFSNTALFAQSPDWLWANNSTGSSYCKGNSIGIDANGNSYATGYFTGSSVTLGTTTLTYNGSSDVFVVKCDALSNVLWAKSAGGNGNDICNSISVDANGNSYITGSFTSPTITFGNIILTNTSASSNDIFIVKYDALGNVLWAKNIGGTSDDVGNSIIIDSKSNLYLTGYFTSPTIIFGTSTLTNASTTGDIFIAKYDSSGNAIWAKRAGNTGDEESTCINVDVNGNPIITGLFFSTTLTFGTTILTNADNSGTRDIFVVKYDTLGNVLWAKSAGGIGTDVGNSICVDANNNSYVTGYFYSPSIFFDTTTLTNISSNNSDIFIVKYDVSGNVLWAKSAGGTTSDMGNSINVDATGNIYLTGYFKSSTIIFGTDTLTNASSSIPNIFVAKYNALGSVLWAKGAVSGDGIYSDAGNCISVDAVGNSYVTGYFASPTIIFDSDTLTNASSGIPNFFIAKLNYTTTDISELTELPYKINIYPNPTKNKIFIYLPDYLRMKNATIELLSIDGKILKTVSILESTTLIDISDLSFGVYFIKTIDNENVIVKKIIKK